MSMRSAILATISFVVAFCLAPLTGCGGGAQATQPTPTPTGPPPGSEFLYVNYDSADYVLGGPSPGLQMATLDPSSGALGSLAYAFDESATFSDMNMPMSSSSMFSTPNGQYLYFETNLKTDGGSALLAFSVSAGGLLGPVNGENELVPQPPEGGPTGSALDGLGRYIYISATTYSDDAYQGQINLFQLNASTVGITQGPTFSDASAMQLTVTTSDAAGNYLYAWNNSQNQDLGISVYKINATTGALAEIPGSPFPVAVESSSWWGGDGYIEYSAMQFVISPSGNFAYANVIDDSNILYSVWDLYAFSVDPTTGAVTKLPGYPISPNVGYPQAMVIHPNGKFLYVSQGGNATNASNGIAIFAVNPTTGAINPTPVSFVADNKYCCATMLINPSGSVLLDEGGGWHSFTVDGSTGLLTSASTIGTSDPGSTGLLDSGPAAIVTIP